MDNNFLFPSFFYMFFLDQFFTFTKVPSPSSWASRPLCHAPHITSCLASFCNSTLALCDLWTVSKHVPLADI